jgi:hypothetical protein
VRDLRRWEAGIMAFHTLSFPWPAFSPGNAGETDMPPPSAMCNSPPDAQRDSSLVDEWIGDLTPIQEHS